MKRIITGLTLALALLLAGHAQAASNLHAQSNAATATSPAFTPLSWTPSTACVSPVTCTFDVYRCIGTCTITSGTWTLITSGAADTGAYTDSTVGGIGVASYYVTDLATGNGWSATPSAGSNVATVTFPVPAPTGLAAAAN
jgi:hypothetical protein